MLMTVKTASPAPLQMCVSRTHDVLLSLPSPPCIQSATCRDRLTCHSHILQVKDLHSWVVNQYFERKGLESCSPEQLHMVLYALEEENHVMISSDNDDLQIRFVM